ncbi:hypothetical protein COL88_31205, partial [Bacillus thuringiensis]
EKTFVCFSILGFNTRNTVIVYNKVELHRYQANKSKYAKTRKLTSKVENLQFFWFKFYEILAK